MHTRRCLWVALLAALPVVAPTAAQTTAHAAPQAAEPQPLGMLRWTLEEKPEQIVRLLGRPDRVDDSVKTYVSWQYETAGNQESDDNSPPSYVFCLEPAGQSILSITRNFDRPQDVDALLPPDRSRTYHWPSKEAPQYSVRVRQFGEGKLLIAMGASKPGERTTQLILVRRAALGLFMPWLAEQLQ